MLPWSTRRGRPPSLVPPASRPRKRGKVPLDAGDNWFWVLVRLADSADIDGRVTAVVTSARVSGTVIDVAPAFRQAGSDRCGGGCMAADTPGREQFPHTTSLQNYCIVSSLLIRFDSVSTSFPGTGTRLALRCAIGRHGPWAWIVGLCRGPKNRLIHEGRQMPCPHDDHNGNVFYGTEGYMVFSRRGAFSVFLGQKGQPGPTESKEIRGQRGYVEHMADFLDAVRNRTPTRAGPRGGPSQLCPGPPGEHRVLQCGPTRFRSYAGAVRRQSRRQRAAFECLPPSLHPAGSVKLVWSRRP